MTDLAEGRAGVLCVGTLVIDVSKIIDHYPPLDGLATISEVSLSTGGAALNLAVDLKRLGAPFEVSLVGAVGDDDHGAYLLDACAQEGIDTSAIRTVPGAATPFTDIMVERDGGRRTFFTSLGTNEPFHATPDVLASSRARILHVGAPGVHPRMDAPLPDGGNGWSTLLAAARSAGIRTNMELAPMDPVVVRQAVLPCLPLLDTIVLNELEASVLTGLDVAAPHVDGPVDWEAMDALALGLIDRGVTSLAVVHFPAGGVAADAAGRVWRQGSVRLATGDVRSTTGAGDAFAAGVIYGLHEGWAIDACMRLGAASAGASVQSAHTSAGIVSAELCLEAAAAAGYREAPASLHA